MPLFYSPDSPDGSRPAARTARMRSSLAATAASFSPDATPTSSAICALLSAEIAPSGVFSPPKSVPSSGSARGGHVVATASSRRRAGAVDRVSRDTNDPLSSASRSSISLIARSTVWQLKNSYTSFIMEWKKLLWYRQPYPDNYTSPRFLVQLKRNSTVVQYARAQLAFDFALVSLHVSNTLLVVLVFYGVHRLGWDPVRPALAASALTVAAFAVYAVTLRIRQNAELIRVQDEKLRQLLRGQAPDAATQSVAAVAVAVQRSVVVPSGWRTFKSAVLILFYLLTLSPVLKSLTNSTSSDSIWALSAWLCVLNLLFNDFKIDFDRRPAEEASSSNLSQNIALSNAIVLASRLDSNLAAFCFILFSIQISGLFPKFNNFTRENNFTHFHVCQMAFLLLLVDYLIFVIFGFSWVVIWTLGHLIIILGGPQYFLQLQKYKEELQGPWDPAKPVEIQP